MLNGWSTKTAKELDNTIQAWAEVFNKYNIPLKHYNTLYLKSVDVRQNQMQMGQQVASFTAELMVSCWHGLRDDLRQKEIEEGRTLTENAESVCKACFGSKMMQIENDGVKGVKRCTKCK